MTDTNKKEIIERVSKSCNKHLESFKETDVYNIVRSHGVSDEDIGYIFGYAYACGIGEEY